MSRRTLPGILRRILVSKQRELDHLLRDPGLRALELAGRAAQADQPPRDFLGALLSGDGPARLIAEIKRASPSKGVIREDFDPAAIAVAYATGGAAAISCLTDAPFFQGNLQCLRQARSACVLPVLRKDFIIHPAQVFEARAAGADAILLIARLLDAVSLSELQGLAWDLGMEVLLEVHDQEDLELALASSPRLLGINNRDLDTFEVDFDNTLRLRELVPAELPLVAESGISDHAQLVSLGRAGIAAVLVGESLMREPDVAGAVRRLLQGVSSP